ncbi:MAG: acyl-CoA thioesterase [Thiohalobacterales bacterium]
MTDSAQLPDNTDLAIRVMATPADTNSAGDIFGGWMMSQVDIAGSIIARRRAQGRVVTVSVNSFLFRQPVFVGDLISCYGRITRVGKTSLTVHVRAFAERYGKQHECVQVTEADVTYVAVDDNRKPRPVP